MTKHEDLYQEAVRLLTKRDYICRELAIRLATLEPEGDRVDAVMSELIEQNYLNDQRVIEEVIRKELRKQHGPARIRQSLRQKGAEQEAIDQSLAALEVDWLSMVQAMREKKFGSTSPLDDKSRAKLVRHLQYRGHSMDVIREITEN